MIYADALDAAKKAFTQKQDLRAAIIAYGRVMATHDWEMLNLEKMQDTICDTIIHDGVTLSSRWGKSNELKLMMKVVDRARKLNFDVSHFILDMWCNSNTTCEYTVNMTRSYPMAISMQIGQLLHRAFMDVDGGHNGITVKTADIDVDEQDYMVDPDWHEDGPVGLRSVGEENT